MRPGWKEVQLSDYISVKHGYAFKGENFCDVPNNNLVVTPGNFSVGGGFFDGKRKYYDGEIPNEYILNTNDLIVTMTDLSKFSDTLGYSALVPNNPPFQYLHNQRIGLVEFLSDDIDREFLYWLMRTRKYQKYITGRASGSTVKHTSPSAITSYSFSCPSLPEQQTIAATLSCLDDKIDLNNKINANLEAQAQAIFKSWFVDFESKDWQQGFLSDIAYINPLRTLSRNSVATYVEMSNLPTIGSFPMGWTKRKFIGGMKFRNGDTLIARITPCLENGKTAYVNFLEENEVAFGSTEYIVLAAKKGYPNELFYFLARDKDFVNYAVKNMSGSSGRQRVSADIIGNYEMLIPPIEFIKKNANLFVKTMATIRTNSFQSCALAAIRDALLPKLMSGEIEVPFTE